MATPQERLELAAMVRAEAKGVRRRANLLVRLAAQLEEELKGENTTDSREAHDDRDSD